LTLSGPETVGSDRSPAATSFQSVGGLDDRLFIFRNEDEQALLLLLLVSDGRLPSQTPHLTAKEILARRRNLPRPAIRA
jgi:hypothetical protein